MKHFGGHYHTSFVRKHEKLSFLKKHDVQKKSLKIPEMQKIKFWWVFHHKWTLYEAQNFFWAICDIFGGGHYHVNLSKVLIFDKISVENELTRAGSSEKKFSKIIFRESSDIKTRKCKKKYTSSTVWALEFNIC